MPTNISMYTKFLGQELISPATILTAFLVGAAINAAQSRDIFFSAIPYIIPLFVQGIAKASLKYKNINIDLLCQLPAERKDPAFLCDRTGFITASQGVTQQFLTDNGITKLDDLFGGENAQKILESVDLSMHNPAPEPPELFSEITGKWYQVQSKIGGSGHILIWMDEISSRKEMEFSLSAIRGFNREVVNSIDQLVVNNDIYERLAQLIIREGYQGVFITREDREGNLSGYVFKGQSDDLIRSELTAVSEKSSAPIWASRRAECDLNACVISSSNSEFTSQGSFEKEHPFDDRVKDFLEFAISNYINYAEGDVSIIAFNKDTGPNKYDPVFINAVVNTARMVTRLIDLATGNNRMLSALELAEEVQQKLLPQEVPDVNGIDVAARVIYCDKAGGDYYDFPYTYDQAEGKLNVVVGDVAGHGIAAGLEMATARALVRSRSAQPGTLSQIVTDVNLNLAMDTRKTGQFMTLFYLTIDRVNKNLDWVRAGHDAALVYNPVIKDIEELFGSGTALGLDEDYHYEENQPVSLTGGELIVLGSDGIWETRNPDGHMFGKQPVKNIMRGGASSTAEEILDQILNDLDNFRADGSPEDDITLVVIKIAADLGRP